MDVFSLLRRLQYPEKLLGHVEGTCGASRCMQDFLSRRAGSVSLRECNGKECGDKRYWLDSLAVEDLALQQQLANVPVRLELFVSQ